MHLESITGSLSIDVFERRTSIESKAFSLLICPDAIKFVLLRVFTLIETICLQIWAKPLQECRESTSGWHALLKDSLLTLPNASPRDTILGFRHAFLPLWRGLRDEPEESLLRRLNVAIRICNVVPTLESVW